MFEEGIKLKEEYGDENIFDFTLGNPNIDPPARFQELLVETVKIKTRGKHGYMQNDGYADTKRAIAGHLSGIHRLPITGDQIVMTCGAGGALNVILKTLLDPGDEVLICAPYFIEYRFYIDNHGGTDRIVKSREDFSLILSDGGGCLRKY